MNSTVDLKTELYAGKSAVWSGRTDLLDAGL